MQKKAYNSEMLRNTAKVCIDHYLQTAGGLSESAVIMVVVAMGMGETLHRFPRNAESFLIKRHAFCLVSIYGGLLVMRLLLELQIGSS